MGQRWFTRYSRPVNKSAGLLCDQTVVLTGVKTKDNYPQPLRRVKYRDPETGRTFNFLTNNFAVPALTVAALYRCRWQVELFCPDTSDLAPDFGIVLPEPLHGHGFLPVMC